MPLQQEAGERGVVGGVEEVAFVRHADESVFEPVGQLGADAEQELVAVAGARLPYRQDQVAQSVAERGVGVDGKAVERTPLAREPALVGDPAGKEVLKHGLLLLWPRRVEG
ncbi:hypothetical protein GCM10020219_031200 [Nonomuraea dietziae]